MITNARLLRIDRSGGGDAMGQPVVTEGSDLTATAPRCFLDSVTSSQRFTLGATIKDASEVCYIPRGALQAAGEAKPQEGDQVVLQMDEEDEAITRQVMTVGNRAKPTLSHFELFLKKV